MPWYINHNTYAVHLVGPNGEQIKLSKNQRIELPDYYERYRQRGFIRLLNEKEQNKNRGQAVAKRKVQPVQKKIINRREKHKATQKNRSIVGIRQNADSQAAKRQRQLQIKQARKLAAASVRKRTGKSPAQKHIKRIVGRKQGVDPNILLKSTLSENTYPISNNIGIGILSYNRINSLQRLLASIRQHTDLRRTTVFISDDGSNDAETIEFLKKLSQSNDFVVLMNDEQKGIAANSNRLLKCLSRFKYGLLLNDDVEVLQKGWESFYFDVMEDVGMHHLMYREVGVYGAKDGDVVQKKGRDLSVVHDKPHGAVMAFTNTMFDKAGYFDEQYGIYGREHVDWSLKAAEQGLQDPGFFDVVGSSDYFVIHSDPTAIDDKQKHFQKAKERFAKRVRTKIDHSPTADAVPSVSYVIPFRNIDREACIRSVVNNVRAQRWPVVDIIMAEQDSTTKIDVPSFKPVNYCIAEETQNLLFNKAKAFNLGVSKVKTDRVILHDADTLVPASYTSKVMAILKDYDGCHLGKGVIYAARNDTDRINKTGIIDESIKCERAVGYFEGGSIACKTNTYWRVGGMNEDFWGYGCEDCEFYARLSANAPWKEERNIDLLHLWHSRVSNWNRHHATNKDIEEQLSRQPMTNRVTMQHNQLRTQGYGQFLDTAIEQDRAK